MKTRYKLMLLFIGIAVIPLVGLRAFGIYHVNAMSEALLDQVRLNQEQAQTFRLQRSADAAPTQRQPAVGQRAADMSAAIAETVSRVKLVTIAFLICLIMLAILAAIWFARTITRPLEALAGASRQLATGDFSARVDIDAKDEFGAVANLFNRIGPQLKTHYEEHHMLELAMEIQSHLLPQKPPDVAGLDVFGITMYSDLTGGDYFDYLPPAPDMPRQVCIAVGDVSGHGIPAALLMASARAAIRLRATMAGSLADILADVNNDFSKDVAVSGDFLTLLLARLDVQAGRIHWVRAGHDPGIVYDPAADTFESMTGQGLPLGIDPAATFTEQSMPLTAGQIIVLSTDGIWEARNQEGNMFGKDRLVDIVRRNAAETAKAISLSILDAVEDFRRFGRQEDDLTIVVIKVDPDQNVSD